MKRSVRLVAAAAIALLSMSCHADTVRWYLSGITFDDGATAVGWFDEDPDTKQFGRFAIFTSSGASIAGHDYIDGAANAGTFLPPSLELFFYRPDQWQFRLTPATAQTDAGGVVALDFAASNNIECNNCGSYRLITAGQLVGVTDLLFGDGFDD